jgi:hypothetical protein
MDTGGEGMARKTLGQLRDEAEARAFTRGRADMAADIHALCKARWAYPDLLEELQRLERAELEQLPPAEGAAK